MSKRPFGPAATFSSDERPSDWRVDAVGAGLAPPETSHAENPTSALLSATDGRHVYADADNVHTQPMFRSPSRAATRCDDRFPDDVL